jgi:hypothetical protein
VHDENQLNTKKYQNVPEHLQETVDISYKLIYSTLGYGYVNPEDNTKVLPIEDAVAGQPLFTMRDKITLEPGDLPNVKERTETSIGIAFLNAVLFGTTVGDKIPFINERFSPTAAENKIIAILEDIPDDPSARQADVIYVDEYLRFCDAAFYLEAFSQLFVPGSSRRSMLPPPNNKELREKLITENKDRLNDPAVVAVINKKLQENDTQYLKGDIAEGFLITKKSREIVRTKKFLMYGNERGLTEAGDTPTIVPSLVEGWDISYFPEMVNTLRSRSYNRGVETRFGGVIVKLLMRASSNAVILEEDCGTQLGMPTFLTEENIGRYKGFTAIFGGKQIVINKETMSLLVNKLVMIRSPQFCRHSATDYCPVCSGPRLAINPLAISTTITALGSDLMLIYMSAAHSKSLVVEKLDPRDLFS